MKVKIESRETAETLEKLLNHPYTNDDVRKSIADLLERGFTDLALNELFQSQIRTLDDLREKVKNG